MIERLEWHESLRKRLFGNLSSAKYARCRPCGGNGDENIPRLKDGRMFCCAIADVLSGSENAVRWEDMRHLTDWAGLRMRYLRDAHEGYIGWALMIVAAERAYLPESFYPFPEDPIMIETPMETQLFMDKQKKLIPSYL